MLVAPAFAGSPEQADSAQLMPEPEINMCSLDQAATSALLSGCTAEADCWDGSTVSCSGNSTCNAVDSLCMIQRGYVKCDGVYTFCPWCPGCRKEGRKCWDESDCYSSDPECLGCFCDNPGGEDFGFCMCP
jgi:hypothetical protein